MPIFIEINKLNYVKKQNSQDKFEKLIDNVDQVNYAKIIFECKLEL